MPKDDLVSFDKKRLRQIGFVEGVTIYGIVPSGPFPPGIMLRGDNGFAMLFTLKSAKSLAWYLNLFVKEMGDTAVIS